MAIPIRERLGLPEEFFLKMLENFGFGMRVSIPGIVQSFDPVAQTVVVQPAIRERIMGDNLEPYWTELPLLQDVPVVLPRAGGFALTMPIKAGDECLVMFADMCIDAWFSNGGIQNQIEKRRHDLSDSFAIMGIWSQPKVLPSYSTAATELRSDDGASRISISNGAIDITSPTVRINGINFGTHKHTAPAGGGTTSGPS